MLFRRTAILNVQQVIEYDNLNIYSIIKQTAAFGANFRWIPKNSISIKHTDTVLVEGSCQVFCHIEQIKYLLSFPTLYMLELGFLVTLSIERKQQNHVNDMLSSPALSQTPLRCCQVRSSSTPPITQFVSFQKIHKFTFNAHYFTFN